MKKLFVMLFLASLAQSTLAVDIDSLMKANAPERLPLPRFAASMKLGIGAGDDASTSVEVGADWYPIRYAGVGLGVEFDDNHGNSSFLADIFSNSEANSYEYDEDRVVRLNIHPALAFRTPVWYFSRDKDWGLMLQCKPGLCISIPRNSSKNVDVTAIPENLHGNVQLVLPYETQHWKNRDGEWLAWRVVTAASIASHQGALSLGWSISNYNIMSCRNNLYYQGKRVGGYSNLSMTNMLFVMLSVFF